MIRLFLNKKQIIFSSCSWTGSDQQTSRELTFSLASNPYDTGFDQINVKLGDLVELYDDSNRRFLGTVTNRERSAQIGEVSYTAKDFAHHLLRSTGSYKFKDMSPEMIVKRVCNDVGIPVGYLAPSKAFVSKMIFESESLYDIIIRSYREAKAITGKNYMLSMDGKNVTIIEKGLSSGVTLTQGVNITDATYSDTTDHIVNSIKIYDDDQNVLGHVKNDQSVEAYGVYQQGMVKEEDVNAKTKAQSMLVGVVKEVSVEALGDIRATAGKSIKIADKATGLSGTFYITSDSHVWQNGSHKMMLSLSYQNIMEDGAESVEDKNADKAEIKNDAKAYFLPSATAFHSRQSCTAISDKMYISTSTVEVVKSIKITVGKNKGQSRYTPCSRCWNTL